MSSIALKNSILFLLLILIFHFAIKNYLKTETASSNVPASKADAPQDDAKKAGDANDLFSYVYGTSDKSSDKSSDKTGPAVQTGPTAESDLNGGRVLGGGLEAFDGFMPMYSNTGGMSTGMPAAVSAKA